MNAVLVSRQPETRGKEHELRDGATTLGREDGNDVVLASPRVSRRHARIIHEGEGWIVEDLGSSNGTWVNDERIEGPKALSDSDVIRFGDVAFTYLSTGSAAMTLTTDAAIPHETVTVMFTDLQGHTALFERLGSEAVYRLLDDYLSVMKREVARNGGRTIKTEGDGLIASFSSVRQAVDCGIAIQKGVSGLGPARGEASVPVRIGINSGEALKQDEDLIGMAVVRAQRVMSQAAGGEVFLSEVSRSLLGPATGLRIVSRGWYQLKGLPRKERLFEVVWREAG